MSPFVVAAPASAGSSPKETASTPPPTAPARVRNWALVAPCVICCSISLALHEAGLGHGVLDLLLGQRRVERGGRRIVLRGVGVAGRRDEVPDPRRVARLDRDDLRGGGQR